MKLEKARKLVAKKLPGYKLPNAPAADAVARTQSAVEVISPSLRNLKRRYFGDHASATLPMSEETEDSGIVMVQRETSSAPAKAVVFRKGKIIGRQG